MDGRHVKVLGRGDPGLLGSLAEVESFLDELVVELGMRALGYVHLYQVVQEIEKMGREPFEDEGGVTGVIVLSTSHCAIHTWPLRVDEPAREMFVLDVYSCRTFEPLPIIRLLRRRFDVSNTKLTDLSSAMRYP